MQETAKDSGGRLKGSDRRTRPPPSPRFGSGEPGKAQKRPENDRVAIISSETRSRWPGSRSVPDPLLYGAESLGNPKTAPDSPQSSSVVYSEDIPLMPDEAVSDAPWIAFLTVVHDQGGHYRKRSSAAAAYGGFSDVYQCDARFADGSRVVVAVKNLRAVKLPSGLDEAQRAKSMLGRLKKELRVWMRLQHRDWHGLG